MKPCENCANQGTTSLSHDQSVGLWVCDDCGKTLCSACKNNHPNDVGGEEEENRETGEAKKHFVRPIQLIKGLKKIFQIK